VAELDSGVLRGSVGHACESGRVELRERRLSRRKQAREHRIRRARDGGVRRRVGRSALDQRDGLVTPVDRIHGVEDGDVNHRHRSSAVRQQLAARVDLRERYLVPVEHGIGARAARGEDAERQPHRARESTHDAFS
jgi:hypothetical protein